MLFGMKSYLKSNCYHTRRHPINHRIKVYPKLSFTLNCFDVIFLKEEILT